MKKPVIAHLNQSEREALLTEVNNSQLKDSTKETISNTIDFAIDLQRQLKDAKISIGMLKKMFGSDGESLKKLLQTF